MPDIDCGMLSSGDGWLNEYRCSAKSACWKDWCLKGRRYPRREQTLESVRFICSPGLKLVTGDAMSLRPDRAPSSLASRRSPNRFGRITPHCIRPCPLPGQVIYRSRLVGDGSHGPAST